MKKVFAEGYWKVNFGDDLFLKVLCERYKNAEFTILADKIVYSRIANNLNVMDNTGFLFRAFNKISNRKLQCIKKANIIEKSNCVVYIGGSIFMENKNYKKILTDRYLNHNKPYFIMGSNFGPYNTEEYKNFCKDEIFAKAKDVCFRESYSHQLFEELENVRHCSDIVFSLDTSTLTNKQEKRVIFSIVDCNHKGCGEYKEQYINKIIEMTEYLIKQDYKITYMSFCKLENDEQAINEIIEKLPKECKSSVMVYNYNGNVQQALELINSAEMIIGTRFHANIVGLLLNKKIIPIGYSKKTQNTLKDMNYLGEIVNIQNIENIDIEKVIETNKNYEFDVTEYTKDARGHFEKLDKYLGGNND